jgi:hypothetical protein
MAGRLEAAMFAIVLMMSIAAVMGQESINVREGWNVGIHCVIALAICFSILGGCTVGVNILHRYCAKRIA